MNRFGDIEISFKRLPPVYGYRSEKLVSLEKALESIESEIDQLPYYINIAKKHAHYPSEHNLSHDQSASIYIYTMEWGDTSLYRVLNKALRSENRQELKIWFSYLKLFETALDKLPTVKEILWRGVPLDIGKSFSKDQLVTWWSINSCTLSVDVIKTFLGNNKHSTLFLIEAVSGKVISGYTEYENENEVILRMGSQFRVKFNPLEQSNGSHIVHMVEVEDKPLAAAATTHRGASETSISAQINVNTEWKQDGRTIAGGNGKGDELDQLYEPQGICIDDDSQSIYIADSENHRIVEWKYKAVNGKVIAGGNGPGNRMNQLDKPTDVIFDKSNNSLMICDRRNHRVIRWSRQNSTSGQIILSNIHCSRLTIDKNGDLYVSNTEKHDVRRWKKGETNGRIVAGGNGQGNRLNQLDTPMYIFVDEDLSVYVSDYNNHRVMKWMKDANEGIVVAGGHGEGNSLKHLHQPQGVIVDDSGNIYVADFLNHRIMCWSEGSTEGRIIVGGNGKGAESNQLNYPRDLAFDRQGNLYVVDSFNHRIQKFDIDSL